MKTYIKGLMKMGYPGKTEMLKLLENSILKNEMRAKFEAEKKKKAELEAAEKTAHEAATKAAEEAATANRTWASRFLG